MDVKMEIVTGGGKKANRMSHSYTAKRSADYGRNHRDIQGAIRQVLS